MKGKSETIMIIGAIVVAFAAFGSHFAGAAGDQAGKAGAQFGAAAVKGGAKAGAGAAVAVCEPGGFDHWCALPANGNKMEDASRWAPPTTLPPRVPYPAPNGPIRPLPSQTPAAPQIGTGGQPKIGTGGSDLPKLGEAPSGGILGDIPAIGPAAEGIIKAIGPAVP